MKSIATRIQSLYTRQGTRPRFFIRIPDANLFLATQSLTDAATAEAYADKVQRLGTITETMDWLGGIGSVSGVNIDSIQLGQRITLCTEANIEPESQSAYAGAGRLICTGSSGGAYADTRNATACTDFGTPSMSVGRIYNAGGEWFTVIRGFMQFKVPAGITSLDDAYLALAGSDNGASTAFTIQGVAGTWSNLTAGTGLFNDFTGWAASGTYGVTNLLETWTTAEYGAKNYLRFNEAGRAAIKAAAGGMFRMILISSRDSVMDSGPSGNEYVTFESTSARLALRYNTMPLENADAEIYLDYVNDSGAISTTYSTMQLLRKYLVDDYSITDSALSLALRDNNFRHDPLIPSKVINTDDWPDCPEENVAKGYPVVIGEFFDGTYGAHESGIGRDTSPGLSGLRDYAPSPVVRIPGASAYETPGRILIAATDIKNSLNGLPAIWDSSRKKYARLWANVGSDVTASDGSVYVEYVPKSRTYTDLTDQAYSSTPAKEDFLGTAFSVIPSNVIRYDGATNPEYGYVGDGVNYATLAGANAYMDYGFDDTSAFVGRERVEIVFDMTVSGTAPIEVALYETDSAINTVSGTALEGSDGVFSTTLGVTSFDSATGTFITSSVSAGDILVIKSGTTAGEWPILAAASQTRLTMLYNATAGTGLSWKVMKAGAKIEYAPVTGTGQKIIPMGLFSDEPRKYRLRFTITSGAGSVQIQNVQIRVFMKDENALNTIYLDKNGYVFGSWIDAAGRSGSYDEGDLIENPAHAIESIARNEMSLATADINTAAFDTAATELAAWKYAFQISDQKKASAYLDALATQCKARVFWDSDDKLSIKVLDSSATFPKSGTNNPSGFDIFDTTGTPSSGVYATNPILPNSLKIDRVSMDEVYNDFVLKYKKNYASGEYAELVYMTNGAGTAGSVETNIDESNLENSQTLDALKTLCADNYTLYGATRTLTFEAWAIRDAATATKLLQYLIERTTERRYMVTLTTKMTATGHELGDFINIRDARVIDLFGTATAYIKKWEIIEKRTDLDNCEITITAVEV